MVITRLLFLTAHGPCRCCRSLAGFIARGEEMAFRTFVEFGQVAGLAA
jgi:hypothetical protein